MFHKSRAKKGDSCNPAELLSMMAFYSQMHTNLATPVLLKMGGFNINGLRGTKQGSEAKPVTIGKDTHKFAWNDTLEFGICTCFKWIGREETQEKYWAKDISMAQHKMHQRRITNGN